MLKQTEKSPTHRAPVEFQRSRDQTASTGLASGVYRSQSSWEERAGETSSAQTVPVQTTPAGTAAAGLKSLHLKRQPSSIPCLELLPHPQCSHQRQTETRSPLEREGRQFPRATAIKFMVEICGSLLLIPSLFPPWDSEHGLHCPCLLSVWSPSEQTEPLKIKSPVRFPSYYKQNVLCKNATSKTFILCVLIHIKYLESS